jgi:hypothetical protein
MGTFKDELSAKGWMLRAGSTREQPPATHLFLDQGRAAVPDDMAGVFLNSYTNALLRGETVCCVELKTTIFKMFFDVDALVARAEDAEILYEAFELLNRAAAQFWILPETPRLVVCSAPPKNHPDGIKYGFHLVWPTVYVNAPIALAFRSHAIELLQDACASLVNSWQDILDACVFKSNGLRMPYSDKGIEGRPYLPTHRADANGPHVIESISVIEKRAFIHELSLRTFDQPLTPCRNGIEQLADEAAYAIGKNRGQGSSVRLEAFADILPAVQAALPACYETQRFVGAFRMEHAVMLRSSSRFCQCVDREHRTSTVYFCITRRGVNQRCYCRKEEACTTYSSEWYTLPDQVIEAFIPPQTDVQEDVHTMPSKKKESLSDLHLIFMKSRPAVKLKKKVKAPAAKRRS